MANDLHCDFRTAVAQALPPFSSATHGQKPVILIPDREQSGNQDNRENQGSRQTGAASHFDFAQ